MTHPLYTAAIDADNAFQRALVKEYGERACDMRYRTKEQTPAIRELGKLKVAADETWLECMRNRAEGRKGRGA
jgi:hypothetical protein